MNEIEEQIRQMDVLTGYLSITEMDEEIKNAVTLYLLSKKSSYAVTQEMVSSISIMLTEMSGGEMEFFTRMLGRIIHIAFVSLYVGAWEDKVGKKMEPQMIYDIGKLSPEGITDSFKMNFGKDILDIQHLIERNQKIHLDEYGQVEEELYKMLKYKPDPGHKDEHPYIR